MYFQWVRDWKPTPINTIYVLPVFTITLFLSFKNYIEKIHMVVVNRQVNYVGKPCRDIY